MNESENQTVWVGAFRYYLGRMTYAVDEFCTALVSEWPDLPLLTKSIISRELEKAFAQDDEARKEGREFTPLGAMCDRKSWEKVMEVIK